jgi:hypothetical protein
VFVFAGVQSSAPGRQNVTTPSDERDARRRQAHRLALRTCCAAGTDAGTATAEVSRFGGDVSWQNLFDTAL